MANFEIPDVLAPVWNDPEAEPKPISEQVGELMDSLEASGNVSTFFAVMKGLAYIDGAIVEDRYTDAREWEIAGAALRKAFAEGGGQAPSGNAVLGLMIDEVERVRVEAAEKSETFTGLLKEISKTKQRDNLYATLWDAERCGAAAAVATAAVCDPGALSRIAQEVLADLQARSRALEQTQEDIASPDPQVRNEARREALPFLIVFMDGLKIRLPVLLERAGWSYEQEESGRAGIYLSADSRERGFWVRDVGGTVHHVGPADGSTQKSGVRVVEGDVEIPEGAQKLVPPEGFTLDAKCLDAVDFPDTFVETDFLSAHRPEGQTARQSQVLTLRLDPLAAAMGTVLSQIIGAEQRLYEDAFGCVEAAAMVTESVIDDLAAEQMPSAKTMQLLADALLFAERNAYSGLNMLPLGDLLRRAGFDAAPPADGSAPSLPELVRLSRPGEAYLLASDGHAAAYIHLPDGQRFVYDSEGLFQIGTRDCLASYDPNGAPHRAEAIERQYRKFYGLMRIPLGD